MSKSLSQAQSQSSQNLVELTNAGVRRGDKWLVRGVSFSMKAKEIVTLIGPNGSGKSTTTKMALGVLKADEGSVSVRNNVRIAYVPQKIQADWSLPLSVKRFMRLTNKLSDPDLLAALDLTGTAHLLNEQLRTLSGGEFQRVLLARAIARKPELLVLDEPVQGVDFAGEIAIYELIKKIRDTLGCAILLVSHDLHLVMAATDRVICLNGHVCCEGTPKSVASSDVFKNMFGSQASGLAVYEHEHDHTHLEDGRVLHKDGTVTDHCHPEDGHHHGEHSHKTSEGRSA
ncbi:MAG: ATP-binding cassette domain-containing protein [Nitratireductor sp.]